MRNDNSSVKNKLLVYTGAFLSQISTLLAVMMIVRYSDIEQVAQLAVIDALLLFLPFFLSFMSERTAIIIFYQKKSLLSYNSFSSSFVFCLAILPVFLILYLLFSSLLNFKFTQGYDYLVIISSFCIAVFNISFQSYLINEDYKGLAKCQIIRGSVFLLMIGVAFYYKIDSISALLSAYIFSCLISSSTKILEFINCASFSSIRKQSFIFLKLGYIPLSVLFLGFIISNGGRLLLESYNLKEDLAILLVYSKSLLILLSVLMPLSSYFKPKILGLYSKSRLEFPPIWSYLLIFASIVSFLFLINFKYLWMAWGLEDSSFSLFTVSLMICGGIASWLTTSVVELYYEESKLAKLKVIIYLIPVAFMLFIFYFWGESLNLIGVISAMVFAEVSLLIVSIFISYRMTALVPLSQYFIASLIIIICGLVVDFILMNISGTYYEYIFVSIISVILSLFAVKFFFSSKLELTI